MNAQHFLSAEKTGKLKGLILTVKGNSSGKGHDFYSRYFAPWVGVLEDPVTGMCFYDKQLILFVSVELKGSYSDSLFCFCTLESLINFWCIWIAGLVIKLKTFWAEANSFRKKSNQLLTVIRPDILVSFSDLFPQVLQLDKSESLAHYWMSVAAEIDIFCWCCFVVVLWIFLWVLFQCISAEIFPG